MNWHLLLLLLLLAFGYVSKDQNPNFPEFPFGTGTLKARTPVLVFIYVYAAWLCIMLPRVLSFCPAFPRFVFIFMSAAAARQKLGGKHLGRSQSMRVLCCAVACCGVLCCVVLCVCVPSFLVPPCGPKGNHPFRGSSYLTHTQHTVGW